MARIPRKQILQDQSYFHVTWKCHNDSFLLQDDQAKTFLYDLILRYKTKYRIKIYGYCFMDNHPHIVGYCETVEEFSRFFQVVNGTLARFINQELGRRGQVIMDRLRSPRIQNERHMMHVLHYVDLNPVRAGICNQASKYRWSSYRSRAYGAKDPILDPLPLSDRIDQVHYQKQSQYILTRGNSTSPIYQNVYFIGTPQWVRHKRRELYQQFLKTRMPKVKSV